MLWCLVGNPIIFHPLCSIHLAHRFALLRLKIPVNEASGKEKIQNLNYLRLTLNRYHNS